MSCGKSFSAPGFRSPPSRGAVFILPAPPPNVNFFCWTDRFTFRLESTQLHARQLRDRAWSTHRPWRRSLTHIGHYDSEPSSLPQGHRYDGTDRLRKSSGRYAGRYSRPACARQSSWCGSPALGLSTRPGASSAAASPSPETPKGSCPRSSTACGRCGSSCP